MTLVLELPLDLEERLKQEAQRQGVETADLALHLLQRHLTPTDQEFKAGANHVLSKNAELYRRLA